MNASPYPSFEPINFHNFNAHVGDGVDPVQSPKEMGEWGVEYRIQNNCIDELERLPVRAGEEVAKTVAECCLKYVCTNKTAVWTVLKKNPDVLNAAASLIQAENGSPSEQAKVLGHCIESIVESIGEMPIHPDLLQLQDYYDLGRQACLSSSDLHVSKKPADVIEKQLQECASENLPEAMFRGRPKQERPAEWMGALGHGVETTDSRRRMNSVEPNSPGHPSLMDGHDAIDTISGKSPFPKFTSVREIEFALEYNNVAAIKCWSIDHGIDVEKLTSCCMRYAHQSKDAVRELFRRYPDVCAKSVAVAKKHISGQGAALARLLCEIDSVSDFDKADLKKQLDKPSKVDRVVSESPCAVPKKNLIGSRQAFLGTKNIVPIDESVKIKNAFAQPLVPKKIEHKEAGEFNGGWGENMGFQGRQEKISTAKVFGSILTGMGKRCVKELDGRSAFFELGAVDYCEFLIDGHKAGQIAGSEIKGFLELVVSDDTFGIKKGKSQIVSNMLLFGEGSDDKVVKAMCRLFDLLCNEDVLGLLSFDCEYGDSILNSFLFNGNVLGEREYSHPERKASDIKRGVARFSKLMDYLNKRMGSEVCDKVLKGPRDLFNRHVRCGNVWAVEALGHMLSKIPSKSIPDCFDVEYLRFAMAKRDIRVLTVIFKKVIPSIAPVLDGRGKKRLYTKLVKAEFVSGYLKIYHSDFRAMKNTYDDFYQMYKDAKGLLK